MLCSVIKPGAVVDVDKHKMQQTNFAQHSLDLHTDNGWLSTAQADQQYLYIVTNQIDGSVIKLLKSDLSINRRLQLDPGTGIIQATAQDDHHLFLGTGNTPGKLIKVNKATMEFEGYLALEAGLGMVATLQVQSDFVLVVADNFNKPASVIKVDKARMKQLNQLQLDLGEIQPATSGIIP